MSESGTWRTLPPPDVVGGAYYLPQSAMVRRAGSDLQRVDGTQFTVEGIWGVPDEAGVTIEWLDESPFLDEPAAEPAPVSLADALAAAAAGEALAPAAISALGGMSADEAEMVDLARDAASSAGPDPTVLRYHGVAGADGFLYYQYADIARLIYGGPSADPEYALKNHAEYALIENVKAYNGLKTTPGSHAFVVESGPWPPAGAVSPQPAPSPPAPAPTPVPVPGPQPPIPGDPVAPLPQPGPTPLPPLNPVDPPERSLHTMGWNAQELYRLLYRDVPRIVAVQESLAELEVLATASRIYAARLGITKAPPIDECVAVAREMLAEVVKTGPK